MNNLQTHLLLPTTYIDLSYKLHRFTDGHLFWECIIDFSHKLKLNQSIILTLSITQNYSSLAIIPIKILSFLISPIYNHFKNQQINFIMQILKANQPRTYSRYSPMFQTKKYDQFLRIRRPSLPLLQKPSKLLAVELLASKSKVKANPYTVHTSKVKELSLLRTSTPPEDPQHMLQQINQHFIKLSCLPRRKTSEKQINPSMRKKSIHSVFDNCRYKEELKKLASQLIHKKQKHYESVCGEVKVVVRPQLQSLINGRYSRWMQ